MNDDPKLLKISHTIINMRQVTHITHQDGDSPEITVYFVGGTSQTYEGDIAKALWPRMQNELDLETYD